MNLKKTEEITEIITEDGVLELQEKMAGLASPDAGRTYKKGRLIEQ